MSKYFPLVWFAILLIIGVSTFIYENLPAQQPAPVPEKKLPPEVQRIQVKIPNIKDKIAEGIKKKAHFDLLIWSKKSWMDTSWCVDVEFVSKKARWHLGGYWHGDNTPLTLHNFYFHNVAEELASVEGEIWVELIVYGETKPVKPLVRSVEVRISEVWSSIPLIPEEESKDE